VAKFLASKKGGLSAYYVEALLECAPGAGSLRDALGMRKGRKHAHHVVARRARAHQKARDILRECCIGIDEAVNGANVPKRFHQRGGLHTKKTYGKVSGAVEKAARMSCSEVFKALGRMKGRLEKGLKP
jgi:hypothetical protein